MGIWLEIYSCKKSDLVDQDIETNGCYELTNQVKKTEYLSIKGAYKLSLVVFGVLGRGGLVNKTYGKVLSKDSLKAILMSAEISQDKEDEAYSEELKTMQSVVKKILTNVNFDTEVVLFDFA